MPIASSHWTSNLQSSVVSTLPNWGRCNHTAVIFTTEGSVAIINQMHMIVVCRLHLLSWSNKHNEFSHRVQYVSCKLQHDRRFLNMIVSSCATLRKQDICYTPVHILEFTTTQRYSFNVLLML